MPEVTRLKYAVAAFVLACSPLAAEPQPPGVAPVVGSAGWTRGQIVQSNSSSQPDEESANSSSDAEGQDTKGEHETETDSKGESNPESPSSSEETEDAGGKAASEGKTKSEDESSTESEDEEEEFPHLVPKFVWGPNDEYELQISGETRIRGEYRDNYDLKRSRNRNDALAFTRTFLNFDLLYQDCVRAFVQILDAREIDTWIYQGQESHVDLHQAYLEFPLTGKDGPWSMRVGRQEMPLGREKTWSDNSRWSNLSRRFDGVKGMYRTEELDADIFAMIPNYYERRRGDEDYTSRGRPRWEEFFYGAYITSRHYAPHTIEAYFLGLSDFEDRRTFNPDRRGEDGSYGDEHRYTIGSAVYGPIHEDEVGEFTYYAEGAFQFGRYASDRVRAYLLRGEVAHEWKRKWKPTLALVGTLASGDRDPEDGTAGSLDILFGSTHSPYGIMDVVRPRNLRELGIIGSVEPTDKLKIQLEGHAYWLDSKTDSWNNLPGQSSLRDRSGNSGREIGQEISIEAEYEYSKYLTFEAGAAHFFPGSHPASFGKNDGANFFYLQTEFKF